MTAAPPPAEKLFAALERSWPPAAVDTRDGWRLRDGAGGGKRVSAASRVEDDAEIAVAEAAMRDRGQAPLFMLREGEDDLDDALAARGYAVIDPTVIYAIPAEEVEPPPADHSLIEGDAPLAAMRDLWAAGGIGPARVAVMERVRDPHVYLRARAGDRPGAVAFVACAGRVAMLHALEVDPEVRRDSLGTRLVQAAAAWARESGADWLALAVTEANEGANALYRALGMRPVSRYHYRHLPPEEGTA